MIPAIVNILLLSKVIYAYDFCSTEVWTSPSTITDQTGLEGLTEESTFEAISLGYQSNLSLRQVLCCVNTSNRDVRGYQLYHRNPSTGQQLTSPCVGDCTYDPSLCSIVRVDTLGRIAGMSFVRAETNPVEQPGLQFLNNIIVEAEFGSINTCSNALTETVSIEETIDFQAVGPLIAVKTLKQTHLGVDRFLETSVYVDACPFHPDLVDTPIFTTTLISARYPNNAANLLSTLPLSPPFTLTDISAWFNGPDIQAAPTLLDVTFTVLSTADGASTTQADLVVPNSDSTQVIVAPQPDLTSPGTYQIQINGVFNEYVVESPSIISLDICEVLVVNEENLEEELSEEELEEFRGEGYEKSKGKAKKVKIVKDKEDQVDFTETPLTNVEYVVVEDCGTTVEVTYELIIVEDRADRRRRLNEHGLYIVEQDGQYIIVNDDGQEVPEGQWTIVQQTFILVDGESFPQLQPESIEVYNIGIEPKPPSDCSETQIIASEIKNMQNQVSSNVTSTQVFSPFSDTMSEFEGVDAYCGPISYEISMLDTTEVYPWISISNTAITLESTTEEAAGRYWFQLKASLVDYPSISTVVDFLVDIKQNTDQQLDDINWPPEWSGPIPRTIQAPVTNTTNYTLPAPVDTEPGPLYIRVEFGNMALKACHCVTFDEKTRYFEFSLPEEFLSTVSLVQIFLADSVGAEIYEFFYLEGVEPLEWIPPPDYVEKPLQALPEDIPDDFDFKKWLKEQGQRVIKSALPAGDMLTYQIVNGKKADRHGNVRVIFSKNLQPLSQEVLDELVEWNKIQVQLQNANPMQNFNWTITQQAPYYDELQLNIVFENPDWISHNTTDKLMIYFINAHTYLLSDNSTITEPFYQVVQRLPIQLDPDSKINNLLEVIADDTEVIMKTLVIQNVAMAFFFKTSLQTLWGAINALQFVAYLPLNNVNFPAVSYFMFDMLVQVVSFDFAQPTEIWEFDITETDAYNDRAEWLGFESQNFFDALGSLNFVFIIMIAQLVLAPFLLLIAWKVACCRPIKQKLASSQQLCGGWIRFLLETYLEICVCLVVSFGFLKVNEENPEEATSWDKFSIIQYFVIFCMMVMFTLFVAWFGCFTSRWLARTSYHNLKFKHAQVILELYKTIDEQANEQTERAQRQLKKLRVDLAKRVEAAQQAQPVLNQICEISREQRNVSIKKFETEQDDFDPLPMIESDMKRRLSLAIQELKVIRDSSSALQPFKQDKKEEKDKTESVKANGSPEGQSNLGSFVSNNSKNSSASIRSSKLSEILQNQGQICKARRIKELEKVVKNSLSADQILAENRKRDQLKKFVSLYHNLREHKAISMWYHLIFCLRRIIFVFTAFFLFHNAAMQVMIFVLCSISMLTYLLLARPFNTNFDTRLECFNELSVLLIGYCQVILMGWDLLPDTKKIIGLLMAGFVSFLAFVNVAINIFNQIRRAIWNTRKRCAERKRAKVMASKRARQRDAACQTTPCVEDDCDNDVELLHDLCLADHVEENDTSRSSQYCSSIFNSTGKLLISPDHLLSEGCRSSAKELRIGLTNTDRKLQDKAESPKSSFNADIEDDDEFGNTASLQIPQLIDTNREARLITIEEQGILSEGELPPSMPATEERKFEIITEEQPEADLNSFSDASMDTPAGAVATLSKGLVIKPKPTEECTYQTQRTVEESHFEDPERAIGNVPIKVSDKGSSVGSAPSVSSTPMSSSFITMRTSTLKLFQQSAELNMHAKSNSSLPDEEDISINDIELGAPPSIEQEDSLPKARVQ